MNFCSRGFFFFRCTNYGWLWADWQKTKLKKKLEEKKLEENNFKVEEMLLISQMASWTSQMALWTKL